MMYAVFVIICKITPAPEATILMAEPEPRCIEVVVESLEPTEVPWPTHLDM